VRVVTDSVCLLANIASDLRLLNASGSRGHTRVVLPRQPWLSRRAPVTGFAGVQTVPRRAEHSEVGEEYKRTSFGFASAWKATALYASGQHSPGQRERQASPRTRDTQLHPMNYPQRTLDGVRAGASGPAVGAALEKLQLQTFAYFIHETNPDNGLVVDKTAPGWPASIAATGLALACYPVAVERGFMLRTAAVERTLTTLRFFWRSAHGPEPDATGYQGFYYHFLDMQTGQRAWQCELSTVDTTFLLAGALAAAMYFDADSADEGELRALADALYRRTNWQ
jgi:hypothetical protein